MLICLTKKKRECSSSVVYLLKKTVFKMQHIYKLCTNGANEIENY